MTETPCARPKSEPLVPVRVPYGVEIAPASSTAVHGPENGPSARVGSFWPFRHYAAARQTRWFYGVKVGR